MSENETKPAPAKAAKTTAKPAAAKKDPKAKAPALDLARVTALAAQIAELGGADFAALQARLVAEEGLEITELPEGAGIFVAKMAGVVATASTGGQRQALINWSNAARRVALRGAA